MRILTGLQPSGKLHVGNYFGAMEPAVRLQDKGEAFYFIADYHAMTSSQDPAAMRENVRELAVDFLACGLDPERAVFFRQSAVPEVNELAWILSTVCPMSLLAKCHSYKDKTAQGIAPNHALFAYPVLMAADILLYDSNQVPVGKDQKQHLEVTRDIAVKLNETYGENTVVIPEPIIRCGRGFGRTQDEQELWEHLANFRRGKNTQKAYHENPHRLDPGGSPEVDGKLYDSCSLQAVCQRWGLPNHGCRSRTRWPRIR